MSITSNVSSATDSDTTLTMEKIQAALALLPPPLPQKTYVISRACMSKLKAQTTQAPPDFPTYLGMPLHVKEDQRMACWEFSDPKIARRYLDGELSEQDLVNRLCGIPIPALL